MTDTYNNKMNRLYGAMDGAMKRVGVINTNMQNVNTFGYKQVDPDAALFGDILQDLYRDDSQGDLIQTNQKLDLALTKKNAYLLVEGEEGPERVRGGSFHVNQEGDIESVDGKKLVVLDSNGEKTKFHQTEDFLININGEIYANGVYAGRVAIDYIDKKPGEVAYLIQGKLESSNVDLTKNNAQMLQAKRHLSTLENVLAMNLSIEKELIERYRNV